MVNGFVDKGHGWFRQWFRKVWRVRGGGLYACGFAVTFVVLEVGSLADDVLGIGAIFTGQAIEFFLNFLMDSLMNTLKAFMWPVYAVQYAPPWGAIGLGVAYWLFPTTLKKPIERWMFQDEPDVIEEPGKGK
ncbi:MAG: hypothetical protein QNI98_05165 [Woeseiaceae bacterium]|nr:hypothetical protein [Woeseiaceae bacterium]